MEFDAAQALLDLHSNTREVRSCPQVQLQVNHTEDMVKTANLYMSCFLPSSLRVDSSLKLAETSISYYMDQMNDVNKIPSNFTIATSATKTGNDYEYKTAEHNIAISSTDEAKNKNVDCKLIKSQKRKLNEHLHYQLGDMQVTSNTSFDIINKLSSKSDQKKQNIETRDIGTQTEESSQPPKIKIMELTIKHMSDRIKALEAQINANKLKSNVLKENNQQMRKNYELKHKTDGTAEQTNCNKYYLKVKGSDANKSVSNDLYPCENEEEQTKENTSCKVMTNINSNDLVPIGNGHALVSARLLRHINWNSYTSATRKLLTAIFSRRVLATHSLTGKRSPAFPKKLPKKKLDANLVQDIVQTVVARCSVPENVVRTSITTKCADESKMYRSRLLNMKHKDTKTRRNVSSETSDSDDI